MKLNKTDKPPIHGKGIAKGSAVPLPFAKKTEIEKRVNRPRLTKEQVDHRRRLAAEGIADPAYQAKVATVRSLQEEAKANPDEAKVIAEHEKHVRRNTMTLEKAHEAIRARHAAREERRARAERGEAEPSVPEPAPPAPPASAEPEIDHDGRRRG